MNIWKFISCQDWLIGVLFLAFAFLENIEQYTFQASKTSWTFCTPYPLQWHPFQFVFSDHGNWQGGKMKSDRLGRARKA